MTLTVQRLREVLSYDPETGIFIYRTPRRKIIVGDIAGTLSSHGYLLITIDYHIYRAHRLAWLYVYGVWPAGDLDHKDTIRSHNWIDNLRISTPAQNARNRKRHDNNKSGFKGVHWRSDVQKWRSCICIEDRRINLGYFDTPYAAHAAYCKAAREHFGEFARSA